jgi:hypothetical protein
MIVIGTDTHKKTHTCGAVDALTAAARGELTVPARRDSFGRLLRWARALDSERCGRSRTVATSQARSSAS